MSQITGNLEQEKIVHRLPGRIRIELPGLQGAKTLSGPLAALVAQGEGIKLARANPLTGRLLVHYDRGKCSEANILEMARLSWQKVLQVNGTLDLVAGTPAPAKKEYANLLIHSTATVARPLAGFSWQNDSSYRRQLLNTAVITGFLGFAGLRRLFWGASPLAGSPVLFGIATTTALVSGYPLLSRGLRRLTAGGRVNSELVTGAVGLTAAVLRENILGLMVVWMGNVTSLVNALIQKEYKRQTALFEELVDDGPAVMEKAPAASAPELSVKGGNASEERKPVYAYPEQLSNVYLGLSALTGVATSDWSRSLSMVLASCPGSSDMVAPMVFAAGGRWAARQGIFLKDPGVLQALAGVDTVLFSGLNVLSSPAGVGEIIPISRVRPETVLAIAFSLTTSAGHALAGILGKTRAPEQGLFKNVKITTNKANGIRGTVNGLPVEVGDATFVGDLSRQERAVLLTRKLVHLRQAPLYVARSGRLIGIIGIFYDLNENAMELIDELRINGVSMIGIISGESNENIQPVLNKLGIGMFSAASLSADEQARLVAGLRSQGKVVAVVSDSRASLAALSAADLGIMLGRSMPGTAEAFIPEGELKNLLHLFRLSRSSNLRIRQYLGLMQATYNTGLCLGAFRWFTPALAVMYNSAVTLALGLSTLISIRRYSAPRPCGPDRNGRRKHEPDGEPRPGAAPGHEAKHILTLVKKEEPALSSELRQTIDGNDWPRLSVRELLHKLDINPSTGLTAEEVERRLREYGPNKLAEGRRPGMLKKFIEQMSNIMVQALLGSTAVCFLIGEYSDAIAILAIVVMNAIFTLLQEQKAENALSALKEMTAPTASTLRDGQVLQISAAELVPGDVVFLEQGDGVPADVRLIETNCFEVEESSLTGESCPVTKKFDAQQRYDLIHQCSNMAFMGTTVSRGRATAAVVSTGMNTEMGKIAGMLTGEDKNKTPLQYRLEVISKSVLKACLAASGIVIAVGILRGQPPFPMFMTGVSLAVAAIPEGLPATVTVAMAAGVRRMAKKHAIVRRLSSVEALGCASVICSDKTGTMTRNQLTVQAVYSQGQIWHVSGAGYDPEGDFFADGKPVYHSLEDGLMSTLTVGILCGDARVLPAEEYASCSNGSGSSSGRVTEADRWVVLGNPLEGALVVAGMKAGLQPERLRRAFPRLAEIPFDSERGYMAVAVGSGDGESTFCFKGAPERILTMCTGMLDKGQVVPLTGEYLEKIKAVNENLSGQALRVLAMAYRPGGEDPGLGLEEHKKNLIFLGLVGMRDPLRLEVRDAVDRCRRAGINVAMITGDHRNTAMAIGRELGILDLKFSQQVLTGPEMESMSDEELRVVVGETRVFARALPRHKMRLVKAFKGRGEIVAMIGDGVNDAPAVKCADIGVAMGRSGTDVTRESSVMIITDDNFATVVTAVEQGRGIFDNIRKSVRYLLATNVGEVVLVFLSVAGGLPLPLLPIQLLFLNILGDGFPAIALGMDKTAPDTMSKSPRSPRSEFFDTRYSNQIFSRGTSIGIASLGGYLWGLRNGDLSLARTITLATLTLSQLLHAQDCRWEHKVKGENAGNKYLTGAIGLSALLLSFAIYLPSLRTVFKLTPLGLVDWGAVGIGVTLSAVLDKGLGAILNVFRPLEKEAGQLQEANDGPASLPATSEVKLLPPPSGNVQSRAVDAQGGM